MTRKRVTARLIEESRVILLSSYLNADPIKRWNGLLLGVLGLLAQPQNDLKAR
jgi:hypothetical protein